MDIVCYIFSALLCLTGVIGCFIPMVPGPPFALLGYLVLLFTPASDEISATSVGILSILTILTIIFDYVIPSLGVKWFGGTSYGKWGSFIGTILGLLILPWGLILGPFLGAFIGELIGKNDSDFALRSGIGSLIGFLCGTLFKVVVTIVITYFTLAAIF